jgi:DNA mismatch repair protein MutH
VSVDYKQADEATILKRARELVGRTLREVHGGVPRVSGKGGFGSLLESLHFGMKPSTESAPDFEAAGLELKATGVVRDRRGWKAKERLVLNVINYEKLVEEEEFTESSFFAKNRRTLVVLYEYEADVPPGDLRVVAVGVVDLERLDPAFQLMIEQDWRRIRDIVREGSAHELSETDTFLLAACPKGSKKLKELRRQPNGPPAQQRAFSFKPPFVTELTRIVLEQQEAAEPEHLVEDPSDLERRRFEELVLERLNRFSGMTVADIRRAVAPELSFKAKSRFATLTRRMLGVRSRRIAEFEAAGIEVRTVRVEGSGRVKESASFPAFKMKELVTQSWRTSDLRALLSRRLLFVFLVGPKEAPRFSHAAFWSLTEEELAEARRVWVETVCRIRRGRVRDLPKTAFSPLIHVRPHGRNKKDVDVAPDGQTVTKQCFWLNASYLAVVYAETKPPSG